MSYCVNCGVELDSSASRCPLCGTPVLNPNELQRQAGGQTPFPESKGQVEPVRRRDLGILMSVVLLTAAVVCGILNRLVYRESLWSLAVLGACVLLWTFAEPFVLFRGQPVYFCVFCDGAAVVFLLYMIVIITGSGNWFFGLGVPLAALATATAELFILCVRVLPRSFLTVFLYFFTASGILCLGIEALIDVYAEGSVSLGWSAVVLTVMGVADAALIVMLSSRRLRNSIRRRLHF